MSSPTRDHDRPGLGLSRAEAWAVHAALLAHLERAADGEAAAGPAVALLERVESGDDRFTPEERRFLAEVLSAYLADAPRRDRGPVRGVLSGIAGYASSSQ
jgi:hypothetical protein